MTSRSAWRTRLSYNRWTRLVLGRGLTTTETVLHKLLAWVPNSANWWRYPDLTYRTINAYPDRLTDVVQALNAAHGAPPIRVRHFKSEQFGHKDLAFTERLSERLTALGSDKATTHDYYRIYADLLVNAGVAGPTTLLEIGMGTNNPKIPSSMGVDGRPGASLRAFRDLLPHGRVFGADVDRDILFQEDRIRTAWVDQLEPASFDAMAETLGQDTFDIIIDDGLHSITANLGSLLFAMKRLAPKGVLVVEDVHKRALPSWEPAALLLNADFDCFFVKCRRNHVFVLRRR